MHKKDLSFCDDNVCCQASKDETIRHYYTALSDYANGKATDSEINN